MAIKWNTTFVDKWHRFPTRRTPFLSTN